MSDAGRRAIGASLSRRELLVGLAAVSGVATLTGCPDSSPHPSILSYDEITSLTLANASRALEKRQLSPVDLVTACLSRIKQIDPRLNSFITVAEDQAMSEAKAAEKEITAGKRRGPLHGIPIAIKDNIDTAGLRTTGASQGFQDRVPERDAAVVAKLKAAGAIIIGKNNMHEFAVGTTSVISHFGAVRNPWNFECIAGGSSGGSAAAVAAGLCYGAVGTDTGGSVRIPASCCGIVGLKPTYEVVDVEGTILISRSFDHIGPMCRTVSDTAMLFSGMSDHPVAKAYRAGSEPSSKGLRVGVLTGGMPICDVSVEDEVQGIFNSAVEVIRSLVSDVRETQLSTPELGEIINFELFEIDAKRRADFPGRFSAPLDGSKPVGREEYIKLTEQLAQHRSSVSAAFSDVDLVVVPTLPTLPIEIKAAVDPFAQNACTFAFSIGGLPCISVPIGFSRSGLPVGMLIGGPHLSEPTIFALAAAYERATEWHKFHPTV